MSRRITASGAAWHGEGRERIGEPQRILHRLRKKDRLSVNRHSTEVRQRPVLLVPALTIDQQLARSQSK
jgi:hypothetical protein